MFPGFADRFKNEIAVLVPAGMVVKVVAHPEHNHSVLTGALLLLAVDIQLNASSSYLPLQIPHHPLHQYVVMDNSLVPIFWYRGFLVFACVSSYNHVALTRPPSNHQQSQAYM